MTKEQKSNQAVDLLISFDTTGSMYQVINSVRRAVNEWVRELFKESDENRLRIGIIAHGDYCDKDAPYVIRAMDFTNDVDKICEFVSNTENTHGGDAPECYELVLNTARKEMNWNAESKKILIMIGDEVPHEVGYRWSKHTVDIDWKNETKLLAGMGVQVYAVHALSGYRSSRAFYEYVAKTTNGLYLKLDQFREINDLISASVFVHYREEKINDFITIIKNNGKMTRSMANNLSTITGQHIEAPVSEIVKASKKRKSTKTVEAGVEVQEEGLVPVNPGRFQIIEVTEKCSVREFVEDNGIKFKKGRAFYQLTKAEEVQQYKEIILEDKLTGDMYTGAQVREYLELQPQLSKGGVKEKVYADKKREYNVYVQSTSVNRALVAETNLLYEVEDI